VTTSLWLVNALTVVLIIAAGVGAFWGALMLLAWITFHVQRMLGMHPRVKELTGSQRVENIKPSLSNKTAVPFIYDSTNHSREWDVMIISESFNKYGDVTDGRKLYLTNIENDCITSIQTVRERLLNKTKSPLCDIEDAELSELSRELFKAGYLNADEN
jgi:hypothetical protein